MSTVNYGRRQPRLPNLAPRSGDDDVGPLLLKKSLSMIKMWASRLAEEGNLTKALQALLSPGLADYSRATLEEIIAKHPFSPPPTIPTTEARPMSFSPQQVLDAAKSFHKGSAAGPSGLRPEHLQIVTKAAPPNRSQRALTQLTRVVNLMASGGLPAPVIWSMASTPPNVLQDSMLFSP